MMHHRFVRTLLPAAGVLATLGLGILLLGLGACTKSKPALHVFTWVDYIDPDLVKAFEEEHGCQVVFDTFESNESMLAKLRAGASGYDIVVPSSYTATAMQKDGMLQPIDHAKVPNLKHVDPDYLTDLAFDKKMEYSVPYMISSTGLAYLASKVTSPEPSWSMLERPDLKGRITLLNDMREVIGAALKSLGFSLNSTNDAELAQAKEVALRWKANIAKFAAEEYKTGLASGEFLLVQGYNGDILQVKEEQPDISYVIPREGSSVACDDLVVMKSAPNPDLAFAFINFLTDPANAAKNTEFTFYLAPNTGAYPLVSEEVRNNPAVFPPKDVLKKCEVIRDLGEDAQKYVKIWDELKSGQ